MAAKGNSSDSFGTFLEALRAPRVEQRAATPLAPTTIASVKLLALLVDGPRPLTDLQSQSGLSFIELADSLRGLQEPGYVAVDGQPGAEQARLTPSGEQLWRAMR